MIGIICAMKEEMEGIEREFECFKKEEISSIKFKEGEYYGKKCVLAQSGVGKVYAAICAQTMVLNYKPEYIINIGMAGGVGLKTEVCDLVIAKNVIQYDYDISAFGDKEKGQISGFSSCEIPCNGKIIKIANDVAKELGIKSYTGNVLTGDKFVNDINKVTQLRLEFNGLACEMESASIGQVCYLNKVKYGSIKIISDRADKNSAVDFEKFYVEYPQIINKLAGKIISKM